MQGSGRAGSSGSTESRMVEQPPSGVRHGPFEVGERIALTDPKGRRHSIVLGAGGQFHTAKGPVNHDDLIGRPEGVVVTSARGVEYLAMRPLLRDFTVAMPRGAAVVYPKDAALIVMGADIFPGATVLEAGAGSGALSCALLRAVGPTGHLISYERREDFASIARRNVEDFFGQPHPAWDLRVGDLVASLADRPISPGTVDRVILDMLAPWECVAAVAEILIPGGVLCCYVATTTQLAETIETLRAHTGFTEPEATESLVRAWHVEGLAVRPGHAMVGHTGFLITTRRMAPGVAAPLRKRRPAPGAYGENYSGPRISPS
jgi:tRNA (adenine57-N1/adenine58-N1)-methyltransferase catalytic subunit